MIFDAVLFDFDGVLVDSEPLHFACWRDVAARLNLQIDWAWYAQHAVGVADREMVALVCQANARPEMEPLLWELFDEKKRLFAQRIAEDVPMPVGVLEMLATLPLPMAVVSTSFHSEVDPALRAAGVRDRFRAVICGDDVAHLKPHPEPYLTAAANLGARHPLVIEDSEAGASAGRAAGFEVLRVASASDTPGKVLAKLGR